MNQPPPPPLPQGNPPHKAPHSGLSIASLVISIVAFLVGIFPFAGFVGLLGIVLGVVDKKKQDPPGNPERHVLSSIGIAIGILSTGGALCWVAFAIWFTQETKSGSCPHLYAWGGDDYHLDADLASGALYKGAERDDLDRLESLREIDGEYRLRIQNDLQEIDHVDSLALLVVDTPADVEVLPAQTGELLAVRAPTAPLTTATSTSTRNGDTRETTTFTFARSKGANAARERAKLVINARTTPFAEKAFVKYLAEMGSAVGPLLEWRGNDNCVCYKEYLSDEMDRMGLPLEVEVATSTSSTTSTSSPSLYRLDPVGPAILRRQVLAVDLRGEGDVVVVKLTATPRFWEIADVALAPDEGSEDFATTTLLPSSGDGRALLLDNDKERVSLSPGQHIDVAFAAPAPPADGRKRTIVAKLRGYYDLPIGGRAGVNLPFVIANRAGFISLPRYAASM